MNNSRPFIPELLSPAGSFDAALAAFQYGADAVYLGLPQFSARAEADNLTPERLQVLLAYAQSLKPRRKIYVTFNTLVETHEIDAAFEALQALDDLAPDGVIVQDLGIARLLREHFPRLALHASTQLAAHNLDGVLALRDLGFTRVVTARELTLDEIADLVKRGGVEIEIFIHGALCYSYSGLCLFSSRVLGRSGNRGRCAYCCRESFTDEAGHSCHPFSMRDLALAPEISRVVATGAQSLKIEGRMKNPLYVACVTDYYRRLLDKRLSPFAERNFVADLQTIFSRPWTSLYAAGHTADPAEIIDPTMTGHRGTPIGKTEAVISDDAGKRWVRFRSSRPLEKHDVLQFEVATPNGRPFGCAVDELRHAHADRLVITTPGDCEVEVSLPSDTQTFLPPGTPVYCSASQAVRRRYEITPVREADFAIGRAVDFTVTIAANGVRVRAVCGKLAAEGEEPMTLEPAKNPARNEPAAREAFSRLGGSGWRLGHFTFVNPDGLYAPPSRLNEIRRRVLADLDARADTARMARKASFQQRWASEGAKPTAAADSRTAKFRAEQSGAEGFEPSAVERVVLDIGHASLKDLRPRLQEWAKRCGRDKLILALPLLTRAWEREALAATVRALFEEGWVEWECADLGGYRLLKEETGLTPISADWTLYTLNDLAAETLKELGIERYTLSPECTAEGAAALTAHSCGPVAERIIYQHTPLFISETEPCGLTATDGTYTLTDKRGERKIVYRRDGRWVTVAETPFEAEETAGAVRRDYSWNPSR